MRMGADNDRCVFGEMFKGKPILAGSSDLNQAQLIFGLVGTPTEENMPGWSSLPGCEGIRTFGQKPGNLHEVFKEYDYFPCLNVRAEMRMASRAYWQKSI